MLCCCRWITPQQLWMLNHVPPSCHVAKLPIMNCCVTHRVMILGLHGANHLTEVTYLRLAQPCPEGTNELHQEVSWLSMAPPPAILPFLS